MVLDVLREIFLPHGFSHMGSSKKPHFTTFQPGLNFRSSQRANPSNLKDWTLWKATCGPRLPICSFGWPWMSRDGSHLGVEPKIGFFYPPNHPMFKRVWNHYFHHPIWGTPIFGNTHFMESQMSNTSESVVGTQKNFIDSYQPSSECSKPLV